MKRTFNCSTKKYREDRKDKFREEKEEYRHLLKQKDDEIKSLKNELYRYTRPNNLDTLTTNNNDPLALKQEVQDLNIMLDEVEQQRDEALERAKKLEKELAKTQEVLKNNQLNLLQPLQAKVEELQKIVDEKESDIKMRYKWKLRKYKREMEMEKQINQRLKSQLRKGHYSSNKHLSSSDFCDSQSLKNAQKNNKSVFMAENKENVNTVNNSNFSCTMRRNKSQTLNGNRVVNMGELMKNNTPSQINTQKNLKEYFLKFDNKDMNFSKKMQLGKNESKHSKHKELRKGDSQSFVSHKSQKRKAKSGAGSKMSKKKKTQKLDSNFFRKISSQISKS